MTNKLKWSPIMDDFLRERRFQGIGKTQVEFQEAFGVRVSRKKLDSRYCKIYKVPKKTLPRITRSNTLTARYQKFQFSWVRYCGMYIGSLRRAPYGIYCAPTYSLMKMGLRELCLEFLRDCDRLLKHGTAIMIRKEWVKEKTTIKKLSENYGVSKSMIYAVIMGEIHPDPKYPRGKMQTIRGARKRLIIVFEGEPPKTIQEWAIDKRSRVSWDVISRRYRKGVRGPQLLESLTQRESTHLVLFGEVKNLSQWAKDERCKVSENCLRKRVRLGWKPDESILLKETVNRKKGFIKPRVYSRGNDYYRDENKPFRRFQGFNRAEG